MQVQSILLALLLTGSIFFASQFQETQSENGNIRQDIFKIFQNWKLQYGVQYLNSEEDYRFEVFRQNFEWIQNYNKEVGYEATGLNHMAGLTKQEYIETFLQKMEQEPTFSNTHILSTIQEGNTLNFDADIPTSVNWEDQGAVTEVMNAGSCSSSYAIASAGAIASIYKISGNDLIPLSPQQLISCDKNNGGCKGGISTYSFLYAMEKGVIANSTYPYTSKNGSSGACKYQESDVLYKIQNMYKIKYNAPDIIKQVVAKQPVTAKVDATDNSFRFYKGGETPYHSNFCLTDNTNNVSYTVLITGYNDDVEDEKPYWIIQASFGNKWGNDGYMYLQNKPSGVGYCGINTYATFPGMTK